MRIASGGIQHETNTFSHVPTTLADFVRDSACGPDFAGGDVLKNQYRGTGTIHGGYIDAAEAAGDELLALLTVHAQPAGVVTQATFEHLQRLFLDRLAAVLPVDGVLLDLHGAMVTEGHEDPEGEFIAAVRRLVGPATPIVATFDLHANLTARMAAEADTLIGYDTYPHVDMHERGVEAVAVLRRIVAGELRPTQAFRQLPLITQPPKQCTLREPMRSVLARVHVLEREPGVVTATIAMGFPYADIHDAGVSVVVTTDDDQALAERQADRIAGWLWELRDELQPDLVSIDELLRFVRDDARGLVIYADGSDNPGGGAPCDGTVVLRALVEANFDGALVGVLFDPETVAQAHAAGVGATLDARIGGKTDDRHGAPLVTRAYVKTLSDGRFTYQGPMWHGKPGDLGPMALLVVGGVEIALASRRQQWLDAEMVRILGTAPERKRLLVVKSAVHFRAHLGPLAAHIFDADTPGIHRPDFASYTYRKLRRPIYPLDGDVGGRWTVDGGQKRQ